MPESQSTLEYLNTPAATERLKRLRQMRASEEWLPISLCSDLLRLKLSHEEHIAILGATQSKQRLVFEDYITSQLGGWDQNVAAAALWEWALRSDCILWHRTLPLCTSPLTTQRIRYTLADLAWYGGGHSLLRKVIDIEGMEEMSIAYHALIAFRALQFDIRSERLIKLAKEAFANDSAHPGIAPEKTMPYYLAYLHRYDAAWLKEQTAGHGLSSIWSHFSRGLVEEKSVKADLKALMTLQGKELSRADQKTFMKLWPALWDRHRVSTEHLSFVFQVMSEQPWPQIQSWEFIAGVTQSTLMATLDAIKDPKVYIRALNLAGSFLEIERQSIYVDKLRAMLQEADDPTLLLPSILPRYSALLNTIFNYSVFT
jgi:hypothetical protein